MTTERRPQAAARPARRVGWSGREWRLYLTALLAAVYLTAWWALAARLREHGAAPKRRETSVQSRPLDARVVWLGDLPPAMRPSLHLPPGWTVATADAPRVSGPTVVRATPRAAARIRTRSS